MIDIQYTRLFSPRVVFALPHLQTVSTRFEFANTQLCIKKDNRRHWNSPTEVFNSPAGYKGEGGGGDKTGATISLYTIDDQKLTSNSFNRNFIEINDDM